MSGLGYSIGRNKPYAGGFITEHYGNPASGLHTVQLELNRAIYMDERRRERSPRFAQVAADFTALADALAAGAARRSRPVPGGGGVEAIQLTVIPRAQLRRAAWMRNSKTTSRESPHIALEYGFRVRVSTRPGMTKRPKEKRAA
jgi:hypothetical protein